jgi:hypothetical protein
METAVTDGAEIEKLNQRVRANASRQMKSLRAASVTSEFWSAGVSMIRCSHFAHVRRRAKAASQSRAIFFWASCHDDSLRLHAASEATANSADSNAMDMPLPVTGGIMVIESPMQISARDEARCGRNDIPATAQKEFSSNSALANRWRKIEPG